MPGRVGYVKRCCFRNRIVLQACFNSLIQSLLYFLKLALSFEPYIQAHEQTSQVSPVEAYVQMLQFLFKTEPLCLPEVLSSP